MRPPSAGFLSVAADLAGYSLPVVMPGGRAYVGSGVTDGIGERFRVVEYAGP